MLLCNDNRLGSSRLCNSEFFIPYIPTKTISNIWHHFSSLPGLFESRPRWGQKIAARWAILALLSCRYLKKPSWDVGKFLRFLTPTPLRWQFFINICRQIWPNFPLKNADVINGWSHILHNFVTPHLVDMKSVVKCWKDFLWYSSTLETYRVNSIPLHTMSYDF